MDYQVIEFTEFNQAHYDSLVLAGDVGGTHTTLCMAGSIKDSIALLSALRFNSQKITNFTDAVNQTLKYLKERYGTQIRKAVLAPAGPIRADAMYCKLTNTSWDIDVRNMLLHTPLDAIALINDFQAIGFGLEYLDVANEKDIIELPRSSNPKPCAVSGAPKVIVGAGTGLGMGILVFDEAGQRYLPISSEGGHQVFAPTDRFEFELMEFVRKKRGGNLPVDVECLLSGRGLVSIYDFIVSRNISETSGVADEIDASPESEKPSIISAYSGQDPVCKQTFRTFIKIFASVLKNAALCLMARGGVYIAGGIAQKNIDFFTDGLLVEEFEKSHFYSSVLKDIPLFVIMNYDVSLYGAANVSLHFPELMRRK
jgi:glucokinase